MKSLPIGSRRETGDRALGLLLVAHPVPSAGYVVAVAALSLLAARFAGNTVDPGRLLLLLAAVACTQIATGATNDVRDLALDTDSRPEKPLVRGLVTVRDASTLAWIASLAAIACAAPLGIVPLLLCVSMEGLGLAYDFGLKRTALSALLFACFFPLLPILAWSVFGSWEHFMPWLVLVLALLGVAMNVANSLPDLEEDLAHGVRGFPHLLGRRWSLAVAWGLPLIALGIMWTLHLAGATAGSAGGLLVTTLIGVASVGCAAFLYLKSGGGRALRASFLIQALGVLGIGGAWLVSLAL